MVSLANEKPWKEKLRALRKKKWVVYAKKPFGSPEKVLDYLGRYTHRVALSNDRTLKVQNGEVTFTYRDRKDRDRKKTLTLEAQEFIRRFLLHVLPNGFMRNLSLRLSRQPSQEARSASMPKTVGT